MKKWLPQQNLMVRIMLTILLIISAFFIHSPEFLKGVTVTIGVVVLSGLLDDRKPKKNSHDDSHEG
ncbi:hypothetical protein [Convivina praedatoris]|uniref:Uncharacterized protein n=1 Tax=Convivina praedatoris TaxID=2880963 RepID=A0ABM9D2Y3_9LACO|nr:hypothetical protein [Convivina sp. LMG 32447]CAH1855868.1 hypothetical protein R077815_01295 [Convivina sp. LMG 32447]CAH1856643.1 hypothetical protein LMG032447_01335 [Convivina sp. LMG 32447]CAH1856838.1 hypothetical protein R078138_01448 [Convivina sp. LMG 32447]